MTTTIELARDPDTGHVRLSPAQAAAVARWCEDSADADGMAIVDELALESQSGFTAPVIADALARFTLATAGVVAAAVAWEADVTAGRDRNRSGGALLAAVRAAGLAGAT